SDFRPPLLGLPEFPANFERFSCLSWAGAVLPRNSPRGRALAAGGSPPTPIFSGRPLFWSLVSSGSSAPLLTSGPANWLQLCGYAGNLCWGGSIRAATLPDDVGGLATVSNGDFYFVRRNGPMDLKIVQASLR